MGRRLGALIPLVRNQQEPKVEVVQVREYGLDSRLLLSMAGERAGGNHKDVGTSRPDRRRAMFTTDRAPRLVPIANTGDFRPRK